MTLKGDPHDQRMTALVRPPDWSVVPAGEIYDLVAIGGGTGGLVAATGGGLLGARTALVERHLLGGDCLVHGCVPSKALLHAAQVVHDIRNADAWGVTATVDDVDFRQVMAKLRSIRADIADDDAAYQLADKGVDVLFGNARFTGPRTLEVDGAPVRFKRAVVATGGRPRVPDVPGLAEHAHTNETIFDLDDRPDRLLVVGGGPIGCELGQAFARLGSRVTLVQRGDRLLPVDDPDASELLLGVLRQEGLDVRLQTEVTEVRKSTTGLEATVRGAEGTSSLACDAVLVAAGRVPNVENLGLDEAGVEVGRSGIVVDRMQRTSNRRIFAVGDVAEGPNFTHAAFAQSVGTVYAAIVPFLAKRSRSPLSWVTYTDPEVAHVGLTPQQLAERRGHVQTITLPMDRNDRARTEGDARGFGRIHVRRGSDRILGATFVGRGAGELIGEIAVLMTAGRGLRTVLDTVHPYPTRSWLTLYLANEQNQTRLTPTLGRWLKRWFAWGLR